MGGGGHQYPDYVSKNNYSLNVSGVSSHNISRRLISLEWSYYEENGAPLSDYWIYDGKEHGLTLTIANVLKKRTPKTLISNFINDGTNEPVKVLGEVYESSGTELRYISYDFVAVNYKAAPYVAQVNGISAALSGNYRLPSLGLSSQWRITKRQLSISWTYDQTNGAPEDGQWTYDKKPHGVWLTIDNIITGDTPTFTGIHHGRFPGGTGVSHFEAVSQEGGVYSADMLFTAVNANSNAYIAELRSCDDGNYSLPASGLSHSWKINPKNSGHKLDIERQRGTANGI